MVRTHDVARYEGLGPYSVPRFLVSPTTSRCISCVVTVSTCYLSVATGMGLASLISIYPMRRASTESGLPETLGSTVRRIVRLHVFVTVFELMDVGV